ncbi:hypothetical protein CTI14_40680, partial [Methylobacterium radiotolerans]
MRAFRSTRSVWTKSTIKCCGPLFSAFRADRSDWIVSRLEYYTVDELSYIVSRTADILQVEIIGEASREIGMRSRGTPRIANRLLKRVRD